MKLEDYPKPSVTVDLVLFTIKDKELKVLLVKRKNSPFKDYFALPGGFVRINETVEDAAKRELKEETNVEIDYLEQLYTFGDLDRDPRGRVITIVYLGLAKSEKLNTQIKADTDASEAKLFSLSNLPKLAFDHEKILEYALKRLKWKFEYTSVAFSLIPEKFTLSDLQDVYEIVFNKSFDKRNFRKKIFSLNILKKENQKKDVSYRPPQLYSLKKESQGKIIPIINL